MAWAEPKTDWTAQDSFGYRDYNRIKNNIAYLHDKVCEEWGEFDIEDMGADIESPKALYDAQKFNAFERNIDMINKSMYTKDYGRRQTFYYNGAFPRPEEFNRLEGAILSMKRIVDGKKSGKIRLAFRLGAQKGLYL